MKKVLIASGVAVMALAMIAGAQGYTFNTNLTVGSTGADVVALQTWLIANGYSIPAISAGTATKGYFGSQTKTAVKAYQTAKGIPSTGFVGPLTRGALNAGGSAAVSTTVACPVGYICTATAGAQTSTVTTVMANGLAGTDGTIATVDNLSQYNNEEVGDGQDDVKVIGLEVKASKEGDVALKSMKLSFVITNTSGSTRLNDYISSVSIWLGSTKIGTASTADFNKDSTGHYSKTITLDNGAILKSDVDSKIYVTVDGNTNLDSGDIDSETITLDVNNIRFEDGSGVVTTDSETGWLGTGSPIGVSFVSFSVSADTELKVMTDSSSPDNGIVVVDDQSDTDDVVLLVGKMRLDGKSDVVINEFPVTLTTTGDSVAAVANSLTLKIDGKEFTETVGINNAQTGTITFDDLDYTIDAGDTVTFTVLANINDIENTGATTTDFDEGDKLSASFTSTNRLYMDAENASGDQLANGSEKTGSITGKDQEFRTEGIALTLISVDAKTVPEDGATNDTGEFTIKYKVSAIGDTMYVSSLTTSDGLTYTVEKGTSATSSAAISATLSNNTDTDLTSVGNYMIEEGSPETFTLKVVVPNGAASGYGSYRASLTGVKWSNEDDATPDNTYSSEMDSFKTDYTVLN